MRVLFNKNMTLYWKGNDKENYDYGFEKEI